MRRVHPGEDDNRQTEGADGLADLCQRLVVHDAGRKLGNHVRRRGSDHVAVNRRVRSVFSWETGFITHRKAGELLQPLNFADHPQPLTCGRRESDGHLPSPVHRGLDKTGTQNLYASGRRPDDTEHPALA
ncbi:hypothetical protein GCM10022207_14250 [Streptomyces lannensis]|uniref:Transposase n=1 Tax=Streptomyces lannensis TaxID=766498 RepID=A0ABP7JRP7_9ACTN